MTLAPVVRFSLVGLAAAAPLVSRGDRLYGLGFRGLAPAQQYSSFELTSPLVNVAQYDRRCQDGHVFLTPRGKSVSDSGPMILDAMGSLLWLQKGFDGFDHVVDLRVQNYKGEDYLTFWAGTDDGTRGTGSYYMLNSSYDIAYNVRAGNNLSGDLHEFQITPNGTALITVYETKSIDLSSLGGPSSGWIYDSLFQEIDIESGQPIFQWRASAHFSVNETFEPLFSKGVSESDAFDFFHIDSVDKDTRGNYYVSSRHLQSIICISATGSIIWVLGGRRNEFTDPTPDGPGATNFSWQHHARFHETTDSITVFDNGASHNNIHNATSSRALHISLGLSEPEKRIANLIQSYSSPTDVLSHSQGSMQLLSGSRAIDDDGNSYVKEPTVFVGWGDTPAFTEFATNGSVLCSWRFGPSATLGWGWAESYRAYKFPWVGRPRVKPAIKIVRTGILGKKKAAVSWNGATEVRGWRLEGSYDWNGESVKMGKGASWTEVATIGKEGFEGNIELRGTVPPFVRVGALDLRGEVLKYSEVVPSAVADGQTLASRIGGWFALARVLLIAGLFMMIYLVVRRCGRSMKYRWKGYRRVDAVSKES